MKRLLYLTALLAACNSEASLGPTQEAIKKSLEATLDDPASYEAVRWGKPRPFMRGDSANIAAIALMKSTIRTEREKGYALAEGLGKDSATQIGTSVVHAFRAKNKFGATVLDSAEFVVYVNGKVSAL